MSLKNTASGYDCIAGSVMKQCVDKNIILPHLHTLLAFQLFNSKMYFPDEWKLSKVIPIFKDGDPQDIQNYRLISVLPFLSMVWYGNILFDILHNNIKYTDSV